MMKDKQKYVCTAKQPVRLILFGKEIRLIPKKEYFFDKQEAVKLKNYVKEIKK